MFRGPPESVSRLSVGLMCSHSPLDECVGKRSGQQYVNVRVLYSVCFHCIILHILGVYLVTPLLAPFSSPLLFVQLHCPLEWHL